MDKKELTLNNIRLSYAECKRDEDRGDLWVYYVVRKVSFYPTWLFLKFGMGANQVTFISMVVAAIGCSFLAFWGYTGKIIGALLINIWIVLDCVDGNIARYEGTLSKYGEFIDALGGYLVNGFLFLSIGIGAFHYPEASFKFISRAFADAGRPIILIVLGAWASLSVTLSRLILHKFINIFSQTENVKITPVLESGKGFSHIFYFWAHNVVSLSGFLTPILLLAAIFRFLSIFVLLYAFINTIILIVTTHKVMVKSHRFKA
jgi:phosphatidylglycerophosphate synthase